MEIGLPSGSGPWRQYAPSIPSEARFAETWAKAEPAEKSPAPVISAACLHVGEHSQPCNMCVFKSGSPGSAELRLSPAAVAPPVTSAC